MLFQWGLILFSLFAIVKTVRQYQAQEVSRYWLVLFTAFWLAVIGAAVTPATTDLLANAVGVGRGADLFVYMAIVLLSYAVYRMLVRQRRLELEITKLVREVAIREAGECPKSKE